MAVAVAAILRTGAVSGQAEALGPLGISDRRHLETKSPFSMSASMRATCPDQEIGFWVRPLNY